MPLQMQMHTQMQRQTDTHKPHLGLTTAVMSHRDLGVFCDGDGDGDGDCGSVSYGDVWGGCGRVECTGSVVWCSEGREGERERGGGGGEVRKEPMGVGYR